MLTVIALIMCFGVVFYRCSRQTVAWELFRDKFGSHLVSGELLNFYYCERSELPHNLLQRETGLRTPPHNLLRVADGTKVFSTVGTYKLSSLSCE
jgi:hypothetical protein